MMPIGLTFHQGFAPLALGYFMLMLEEIFIESLISENIFTPLTTTLPVSATFAQLQEKLYGKI